MTLIIAIVAGIINFMIGALWYGLLFQKPWIEAMGINPEDIGKNGDGKKEMIMTVIVEVIISIVTILFLSAINAATPLMPSSSVLLRFFLDLRTTSLSNVQ
ncbi:DUF1761 domain-containing protein [Streptococcus penaeicida]|uniref:DUF1761 domain-containing protein n=1 Tax=Streptococcus penaeicida TaxID=1765960 RepID=UPI001FEA7576|nr:DUF1761 domain-containing protein [Streptococcus penaeicida]